jgi:multiple sugar transport system permease protein
VKKIAKYSFIVLWSLFVLAPLSWALTTSFKPPAAVNNGVTFIPWLQFQPTLNGWKDILGISGYANLIPNMINSIIITFFATLISVVFGGAAAYGLSRFQYGWKKYKNPDIIFFFISQRIMPPAVLAIPFFLLLKSLKLLDTHIGLILVLTSGLMPIVVWLMVDYFNQIPKEIDELAMLEGCNPLQAFSRTILPLSKPGITVASLFSVIFGWNDLFFALVLTFTNVKTLPAAVVALNGTITPFWTLSASAIFAILPLIGLAFVAERFLSKGSLTGANR